MNKPVSFLLAASIGLTTSLISTQTIQAEQASQEIPLEPVISKSSKINQSAQNSQKKIDRLADAIDDKLQQFKATNKETEGLIVYNKQYERQIQNQLLGIQKLNESIDKVSVIERQITPLMIRMIKGLKDFVSLDVPFLPDERQNRLKLLGEMMDKPDISVSEKLRQILEAYKVEVDYGNTIEAYTGSVKIDGAEQNVNFLRVGRIVLAYQTRDKTKMAVWDNDAKKWESLGSEYRTRISNAIKVAKEQKAPDMLVMPIPASKIEAQ
jgi:hypothetical protein